MHECVRCSDADVPLRTAVAVVTAVTVLAVEFSTGQCNGKVKVEKGKVVTIDAVKSQQREKKDGSTHS